MIKTTNPEINVEDLMQRIREEVALRKAKVANPQPTPADVNPSAKHEATVLTPYSHIAISLQRIPESGNRIQHKPEYNLTDLLNCHGEEFVSNAYRSILRREPDAGGYTHNLNMLLNGQLSRVEILGHLRYSPEGKTRAVPIKGLLRPFILQRIGRIPVVGYGVTLAKLIFRLPVIIKNREQFETYVLLQQRQQVRHLNIIATQTEEAFNRVQQSIATRDAQLVHHMANLKAEAVDLTAAVTRLGDEIAQKANDTDLTAAVTRLGDEIAQKTNAAQLETQDVRRQILDHKHNILDQQRRLTFFLEEARKCLPEPISIKQIENLVTEEDHLLDAFYANFEDHFRGTRAVIKERMAIYLPIAKRANAGTINAPILDIGCGRGEWLELLKENDLVASGIDLNRVMVSRCQEFGLEVTEADAIAYLRKIESNSLGAVTGIHIIEHIPLKGLITLFDEILRVLKPGGLAIFETPNPENIIVGSCNFYFDPTHLNPLPPETTRFILEERGFERTEIMRLRPQPESVMLREGPSQVQHFVNALMYEAMDYSVVAFKS